ncbi:putative origin recognition complex, subunit 5-like protein [Phlebopus sp. FC_14]|nr:putative origin recognition complex, subunit 5-like protein [Phlebopus sp. FC_14]
MDELDTIGQEIRDSHPGYTRFIDHLLIFASSGCLPPFIYITDTNNPRVTTSVLDSVFQKVSSVPGCPPTYYAHVHGLACFTARIFYDTVLNAFAGWHPTWENGCQNWPGDDGQRYNDSIDSFMHGLRRLRAEVESGPSTNSKAKGKEKAHEHGDEEPRFVLLIERAERICEGVPDLLVPLTRLAELSQVKISVIFVSYIRWEDVRPPLGASPDPYYLDVDPLTKRDVIQRLVAVFRNTTVSRSSHENPDMAYHPALLPLYEQYVDVLYSTISLYTNDPLELQYIAAARWPGFVQPVIDQQAEEGAELELPNTEGRLRLFKYFSPTFTAALEALYPRLTNAVDWAADNAYDPSQDGTRNEGDALRAKARATIEVDHLPRVSRFILIAAFLASTNPAKSDMRMFGRGAEERKKRRRKSSSPKKAGAQASVVKASQRLLGPATFPLDRLLAILGALLEENDFESRPHDPRFELPGEYTDMEIGRIHVYAAITELTFMRALHRMTAMEKLDGPPTFKCGISYDVALTLARDVGVSLNELLWDPV